MSFGEAEQHIRRLNEQKFAGYNNWRLPTLEEVMSLMKPAKRKGGLYAYHIDPVFDQKQRDVWTADKLNASTGRSMYQICTSLSWRYLEIPRI